MSIAAGHSARWRRAGGWYLWAQGVGVLGFWAWLLIEPRGLEWFVPAGTPGRVFFVFLAADVLVLSSTSIAAGAGMLRGAAWARGVLAVHVGAVVYAGLCAVMLWALDASRWLGAVMMLPVMTVPPLLLWAGWEREGRG